MANVVFLGSAFDEMRDRELANKLIALRERLWAEGLYEHSGNRILRRRMIEQLVKYKPCDIHDFYRKLNGWQTGKTLRSDVDAFLSLICATIRDHTKS